MSEGDTTSKATASIRLAVKEDVPEILAMIRELADYEKDLKSCKATLELLNKSLGFDGGRSYAECFVLFEGEEVVGMALYFFNFSTWTAKPGVYLEDLFVRPKHRGKGYGTALLAACARKVKEIDGGRLDWQVLDWNKPSIDFYRSIGARSMDDWMNMRVDGDGLEKLGNLGPKIDTAL